MTEQNGNKDVQGKSWDELRQSILEVDAAPYDASTVEFLMETGIEEQQEETKENEDITKGRKMPEEKSRKFNINHVAHIRCESRKLQQNAVKVAVCAVALVCTVAVLKGVTVAAHIAYAPEKPQKAQISVSANAVQSVKAVQQKEAEAAKQKKIKEEKPAVVKKAYTVCIDPGHGGKDQGCNVGNRTESADTLILAKKLKKQLEADGVNVVMTRDTDEYITLQQRVTIANDAKADYFVSLHRNQGDGNGVETWISTQPSDEGKTLGKNIHAGITGVGVSRDRGLKQGSQSGAGNYYVIRCSQMPACLVELGFVNSDTDNTNFDKKVGKYAKAIAQGIEQTAEAYDRDQPKAESAQKSEKTQDAAKTTTSEKEEKQQDTTPVYDATRTATKTKSMDALHETATMDGKKITTDNLKKSK